MRDLARSIVYNYSPRHDEVLIGSSSSDCSSSDEEDDDANLWVCDSRADEGGGADVLGKNYVSSAAPTMEDVLFGAPLPPPPPPQPSASATPQQQQQQQQESIPIHSTDAVHQSAVQRGNNTVSAPIEPVHVGAEAEKEHGGANGSNSGRQSSVCPSYQHDVEVARDAHMNEEWVLPRQHSPPAPRPLHELRYISSMEVRHKLSRFFATKESYTDRFARLRASIYGDSGIANNSHGDDEQASSEAEDEQKKHENGSAQRRDRYARLVNIRRWSSGGGSSHNNTHDDDDVLLPVGLVASSDSSSSSSSNTPSRATLRPHQIEGVRFMWSTLTEGPVGQVPALGCILAHTMGLGKTAQVVIFIQLFLSRYCGERACYERQFDVAGEEEGRLGAGSMSGRKHSRSSRMHSRGAKNDPETYRNVYDDFHCLNNNATTTSSGSGSSFMDHSSSSNSEDEDGSEHAPVHDEQNVQPPLLRSAPQRVLIVVPKSTLSVWVSEFARWTTCFPASARWLPTTIEGVSSSAQRLAIFRRWRRCGGILLVGYEALARLIRLVEESRLWDREDDDTLVKSIATDSVRESAHHRHHHGKHSRRSTNGKSHEYSRDFLSVGDDCLDEEGSMCVGGVNDPFTELLVCDEAHRLKSAQLQIARALQDLHPLRRLLLTGTPLQNHLGEYWAMVDFTLPRYFDRRRFRDFFVSPIECAVDRRASAAEVAEARKKTFTLIRELRHFVQRVDSTPLRTELPALHEYVVVVALSTAQRELYLRFLDTVARSEGDGVGGARFLPMVSMAGKIAAHPRLVYQMGERLARYEAASVQLQRQGGVGEVGDEEQQQRKRLSSWLSTRSRTHSSRNGALPSSEMSDTSERHASTCRIDVDGSAERNSTRDTIEHEGENDGRTDIPDDAEDEIARVVHRSLADIRRLTVFDALCRAPTPTPELRIEDGMKLHVALQLIRAAMRVGEKTLMFSLSTALLDLFEQLIARDNAERQRQWAGRGGIECRPMTFCRLDGSHSSAQRTAALQAFNNSDTKILDEYNKKNNRKDSNNTQKVEEEEADCFCGTREYSSESCGSGPDVFLLSIKAGGVGVTITRATRIILVDTSFNPADDQQAIGRAYRYGQTRPVFVYRLLCHRTLEFDIFEQKLAKEWLFKTVVEETTMKRDGVSGMHMRAILAMLHRAARAIKQDAKLCRSHSAQAAHNDVHTARVSSSALSCGSSNTTSNKKSNARRHEGEDDAQGECGFDMCATLSQRRATRSVFGEDALLRSVCAQMVYAQHYAVFLESDQSEQYGEAEMQYYQDFQRGRLFDVSGDATGNGGVGNLQDGTAAQTLLEQLQQKQRAAQMSRIEQQSRSLTSMVNDLVRAGVARDPSFGRLLSAMGLRLVGGDRAATHSTASHEQGNQSSSSSKKDGSREIGETNPSSTHNKSNTNDNSSNNARSSAMTSRNSIGAYDTNAMDLESSVYRTTQHVSEAAVHRSRRPIHSSAGSAAPTLSRDAPVLLVDEEDEDHGSLPETTVRVLPVTRNGRSNDGDCDDVVVPLVIDASKYASYRPGASSATAFEIDDED